MTIKTQIIAHRGYRAVAPENTLPAFEAALAYQPDMLEMDVHRTLDGHLVVIHDEKVDRTTNGTGFVKDMTLAEIKSLDAGIYKEPKMVGVTIPTFDEFLTFLRAQKFDQTLMLEIKTDHVSYPGIEKEILDKIDIYKPAYHVLYQSFNLNSLKIVRQLQPKADIAALVYWATPIVYWLKWRGVFDYIHSDIRILKNKPRIFWRPNMHIRTWTVDNEADMRRVFKAGLRGMITNKVALATKIRREIQGDEHD
ncbi:glycerophosphoryl diester phosphodiesterase [Leuconostoc gasicomitatum]|uniref:Glycerophosphoryl diester phosphodiesterase n=2 Tax=Leuconostoc TaxID=1243 RepID=A0AAN2QX77_9LACO|nr:MULTISPECIES: glycerophosphodiester phosphodiesterase family protein [Leuconostoc]MBZ5956285.1 glycerophosphodiester phosphodiesterase [Leuconostoc gasicomitatum]MBZ5959305.1 glycerophosphodiester phosphodiesterase [Leuconostoc gasicomitatum]MBZ5959903.1 glycerophosphodiester phosphodiesterase [Leuconostoc gasicomitatum]MBZ5966564.1 glycerophosphodiester phosphodiesterase [Leuconostoc gasicomitatum]MBZ5980678.1 glycerophosphodiester phosphodiesterase [Leuconostoc gasicomitatum]